MQCNNQKIIGYLKCQKGSHFEKQQTNQISSSNLAANESVRKSREKHKRDQCYLLEMKDAIQVALLGMMP